MTYSSCSSLLLVLLFFLFYSSCSNFLIFHFADFIHLTKACIDGVLLIPFSISFVSLNYACNIYGWMMKLCVGYLICLLCNGLLKYIYICHIYLLWKLLDLIKNRKKSQYAGSLPSATDGNGLFAVCRGRQRRHMAASCASWELTHLVSLPTVADGKE